MPRTLSQTQFTFKSTTTNPNPTIIHMVVGFFFSFYYTKCPKLFTNYFKFSPIIFTNYYGIFKYFFKCSYIYYSIYMNIL